MSAVGLPASREQAPDVWWSPELGLIWSDTGGRSYQRVEAGRVMEFFHLPAHAVAFDSYGCVPDEGDV